MQEKREHEIHSLFVFALILKGLDGLLEICLAAFLAFSDEILPYILNLANNALIENPNDFLATHLSSLTHPTQASLLFASLYLTAHGTVKIVLALSLWFKKIWAYPAAIAIVGIFIVFQGIRIMEKGSMLLLLLTIFDCAFVWLIYHEYRQELKRVTIA